MFREGTLHKLKRPLVRYNSIRKRLTFTVRYYVSLELHLYSSPATDIDCGRICVSLSALSGGGLCSDNSPFWIRSICA